LVIYISNKSVIMQDMRSQQLCCWRFKSSEILCCVFGFLLFWKTGVPSKHQELCTQLHSVIYQKTRGITLVMSV